MSEEAPKSATLVPMAYLLFVLCAGLLVYGFVTVARQSEMRRRCGPICMLHPDYAAADRRAPDFELPRLAGGGNVKLSDYRGKVVVLNFWTRTCGPCLEEMPEIADLARIVKDRSDVEVLAVSTDDETKEVKDTLQSVLKTPDPPFTVLMDVDAKTVAGKYGTHLYPETWIIDKRGVIRARFDGAREWSNAAVVELIDQLRHDGYCPVEMQSGRSTGEAAKLCSELRGS